VKRLELPSLGTSVTAVTPTSERHVSQLDGVEVRHGAAALRFAKLILGQIPRSSSYLLTTDEH